MRLSIILMMGATRTVVAPLLVVAALAASACGSDSDAQSAEPTESATPDPDDERDGRTTTAEDDHTTKNDEDHDDKTTTTRPRRQEDHDDNDDDRQRPRRQRPRPRRGLVRPGCSRTRDRRDVGCVDRRGRGDRLDQPDLQRLRVRVRTLDRRGHRDRGRPHEALTASGLISINDEAGCTLSDPVGTEIEREGSHAEITVSSSFVCDDPDEVTEVDVSELFSEFPAFEDIDVQWISESEQSSAELSPSATILTLRQ